MSIKSQVTFAIKWVSISMFATRIARFLTTVVLARILVPEMFGIVAMASVAIGAIGIIRELGFGAAYIQRQDTDIETDSLAVNTTFFIGFVVNTSLFLLGFALSPAIADFFNIQQVETVLKVMLLSFVLDAFFIVPDLILQKQLQFGKLALAEIARALSSAIIAIPLALLGCGVWSLVFGNLCSRLTFGIIVFKFSDWQPRWEFSSPIAREMFAYGKYIWAFAILSAIGQTLDQAIIGRFWGAASLGYYGMAFTLCTLPMTLISQLVNKITFPAFSKIQHDNLSLKRALIKALANVSIISMPLSFGLIAVANEFILTIYGPKWAPVVPLLEVLAFYGMTLSVSSVTGSIFKAIGKPNVLLYTSIVHHIIMITLLILLRNYGVIGICYAVLVPVLVSALIAFCLIYVFLQCSFQVILEPILKSFLSAMGMFLIIKLFKHSAYISFFVSNKVILVTSIIIGIISYFILNLLLNKSFFNDFRYNLVQVIMSKGQLF